MSEQKSVYRSANKPPDVAAEEERERRAALRRTVTLEEQGPALPIGIVSPEGKLIKSFSTRVWRTKEERELGRLRKPDMSIGKYTATIVAYMCREIGGVDLDSIEKIEERLIHVSRMYLGDVFYLYCWLRREALGNKLPMKLNCPRCTKEVPWTGDMASIEVVTVDDVEALRWEYALRDPIELRKTTVEKFQMSSPRWTSLDFVAKSNLAEAKVNTVRSSIVALNDDDHAVALTANDIDELSKFDLESLQAEIDERFVGPNMSVEGDCPFCDYGFRVAIDWTFENFFGSSSR